MAAGFMLAFGAGIYVAQTVVDMRSPEIAYAYNPRTEFNDEFGPSAVANLARERHRARLERKVARESGLAAFDASLARLKSVIDGAIPEGLKTMTAEELSRRLTAFDAATELSPD
jgi:hypothetical protein